MGRTNWIILVLGGLSCFALVLVMREALHLRREAAVHPVIREVQEVFGKRLTRAPEFTVTDGRKGILTIRPRLRHRAGSISHEIGEFAWGVDSDAETFTELSVVVPADAERPEQVFAVARPFVAGGTVAPVAPVRKTRTGLSPQK